MKFRDYLDKKLLSEDMQFDLEAFVKHWTEEGYNIGISDKKGNIVDRHVDPEKYPYTELSHSEDRAEILNGKYKGGKVILLRRRRR